MNQKAMRIVSLMILPLLFSPGLVAEEQDLKTRIEEVNAKVKVEQEANQQLKDEIASRDKEIAALQQKLKELEAKTAAQPE